MRNLLKSLAFLLIMAPQIALAHGGGLDANQCHYCRTNCESKGAVTGEYHCHAGGNTSEYTPAPSAEPEPAPDPIVEPSEPEPVPPEPAAIPSPVVQSDPVTTPEPQNEPETVEKPQDDVLADEVSDEEVEEEFEPAVEVEDTDNEELPPPTAGETIMSLVVLGGLGYGGYKGVKSVARRLKK